MFATYFLNKSWGIVSGLLPGDSDEVAQRHGLGRVDDSEIGGGALHNGLGRGDQAVEDVPEDDDDDVLDKEEGGEDDQTGREARGDPSPALRILGYEQRYYDYVGEGEYGGDVHPEYVKQALSFLCRPGYAYIYFFPDLAHISSTALMCFSK